ncbi:MAG: zinc transporter ZupT, partial [Candidatus Aenigmatarchaeota archaeon]
MAEAIIFGNVLFALLLTTIAGLSTGIGAAIAYFIKRPKLIYLSFFMGFSGGVMIYVSFVELLQNAAISIGHWWAITGFFLGMIMIGLIDFAIPETQNPHTHMKNIGRIRRRSKSHLMSIGLFTALAIGIHNFPEGLATFASAFTDIRLGIVIALAIAIHNIPEGISVSVPIFYATGNKRKAFIYSFMSGLAEPVGGVIGFLFLMPFLTPWFVSFLLALVGGIMVYISLDK